MKYIKLFTDNAAYTAYTATDYPKPNVSCVVADSAVYYNPILPPHDYSKDYFTVVVGEDGLDTRLGGAYFSTDGGLTWTDDTGEDSFLFDPGEKILLKDINDGIRSFYGTFSVEGNIMSLVYGDNFVGQTTLENTHLAYLFMDNEHIISAENLVLPATTLVQGCYEEMFAGCTSLTTAPTVLPATTLASWCYDNMFNGCTSLTTAPQLPATTLTESCYDNMFNGCNNLNYIKCLATDISASNCTYNWVNGVAASGTFVKNPSMSSWTSGNNGIPTNWTVQDAS